MPLCPNQSLSCGNRICKFIFCLPSVTQHSKIYRGYLKVDINHSNIGSCLYSMSCLMPFQSYSVSYLRINSQNGRIHALKTSLRFKIAFKEEIQYPIKDTLTNFLNQEYAIVFENEPLFDRLSKIKLEDLCVSTSRMHRKGIKSLIDTVLKQYVCICLILSLGTAVNKDV